MDYQKYTTLPVSLSMPSCKSIALTGQFSQIKKKNLLFVVVCRDANVGFVTPGLLRNRETEEEIERNTVQEIHIKVKWFAQRLH